MNMEGSHSIAQKRDYFLKIKPPETNLAQLLSLQNKGSVIHVPIAYIQMKVHPYESGVQSTNLPYTEQQPQRLLQYETHMPSYKYEKVKLQLKLAKIHTISNIFRKTFHHSRHLTQYLEVLSRLCMQTMTNKIIRISNSGKPTNPNIETTYNGNTGQIQHSTEANNVVSTTDSSRPYYSNG